MEYDFIGIENAIIDNSFSMPDELIEKFVNIAKEQIKELCIAKPSSDGYKYEELKFDCSGSLISAKVQGVYEGGVVFNLKNRVDNASYQYDDFTSACLIVGNEDKPMFIINGIDGRIREHKKLGNGEWIVEVNKELVEKTIGDLGSRVDENGYIGVRKNSNFFNKKRNQKIVELMEEKIQLLVNNALDKLISKDKAKLR